MKTKQSIDAFGRDLDAEVQSSVYLASKAKTEKRQQILFSDYEDPDHLRKLAGQVKQHTLEHLDQYLEQAEAAFKRNGVQVHWASDEEAANRIIADIMREKGAKRMVKSKSMVSEETELVPYLEKQGFEAVETDLGEFIVQIDHDHPSHIVTPIIHKNRRGIAQSFLREKIAEDYNDDPETITRRARKFLRSKYLEADVGLTGANFVIAESGRLVLVTNEGNARFSMAAPKTHIALVGIEKLVPTERDMGLFLNLLARSSTGQQLTVYTQFIGGPRRPGRPHGPEDMHVVFLDNGRSRILADDCRSILRCIRCGACLNVCPVYRQTSGHAYREVYPGPVGAVLSPLLAKHFGELSDLPKASSLCGACNEVCPVDIPIPELLLRLRDRAENEHQEKAHAGTPNMTPWSMVASSPVAWKTAMRLGHTMNVAPQSMMNLHPSAAAWNSARTLPEFRGGEFRKWMKQRKKPRP